MNDERSQLLPKTVRDELNFRQTQIIEEHLEQYKEWLGEKGRDPDRNIGLAPDGVEVVFSRTVQFMRRVWTESGSYTTRITHDHADRFEQELNDDTVLTRTGEPYTEGSKRKFQDAVRKYFLWLSCSRGSEPWNPSLDFSQSEYDQADYFTLRERELLFETALAYDDFGKYNDLTPNVRDRRKAFLAQKLGKPKSEVKPADFESCRKSWEIISLVSVSLDLGLRPVEVGRFRVDWYKPQKGVFQVPKEEAAKNSIPWEVSLSGRSTQIMNRWVPERETLEKYDGSDTVWLNREGNPYRSKNLNYLLTNLLEEAGIDQEGRKLSWYSIRRSTGTYLTYFESLAFTKDQLRIKTLEATLKYVEIPVEARQNVLDRLNGGFVANGQVGSVPMRNPLEVIQDA